MTADDHILEDLDALERRARDAAPRASDPIAKRKGRVEIRGMRDGEVEIFTDDQLCFEEMHDLYMNAREHDLFGDGAAWRLTSLSIGDRGGNARIAWCTATWRRTRMPIRDGL